MLRFIHAADFHLDSAFTGRNEQQARQRRQESRDLTRRMVEYANDHGVQLMLLAGDLFDGAAIGGDTARLLAETLGAHTLISVGDYENDILLLQASDIGFAVKNAAPTLSRVATHITRADASGAIAEIIRSL